MNTYNLELSSVTTNQTSVLSAITLNDHTTLTCILSNVSEILLPLYLEIDWGDNNTETHENDILQQASLIENRFSSIFVEDYSHEYFPSATTTSQSLTAYFKIKYINNDMSIFSIPINVINYDYQNAVEDLYLVNTTIIPDGSITHQLISKKGAYLLEINTK